MTMQTVGRPTRPEGETSKKGKIPMQVESAAPVANAIQIRGFWRENPRSQNIVSDILKRLRENSESFSFTAKANGKDIPLSDERIAGLKSISYQLKN